VQFKYDTLSNIINDVCGVLQEISRTVGMVMVEKEKTQQVKIMSKAHIHQAEEQTKQVRIQEKEATKRICIQYETEIKKAELHMQEELAKLKYEKELFISNERRFDKELKDFSAVINNIIEQNRYYMQNMDLYPEALQKNNEELVKLVSKMVDLYILSSK
ncbi:MAG: hypothetical protein K2G36_04965, partial [Ruminococcus sp.]|nr:hypothetical protein [Ruminococcus sp.]